LPRLMSSPEPGGPIDGLRAFSRNPGRRASTTSLLPPGRRARTTMTFRRLPPRPTCAGADQLRFGSESEEGGTWGKHGFPHDPGRAGGAGSRGYTTTRASSSTVVMPAATFSRPSAQRVRIPSAPAAASISSCVAPRLASRATVSVICRNWKMPIRPR